MLLTQIRIQNYRSIVYSGDVRIERLQAFVGENNCGKSNIVRVIDGFLSAGTGGVHVSDFFDKAKPVIIATTFTGLRTYERKALRKYLLGDKLILEKQLRIVDDTDDEKGKIESEYHGYLALPVDWWLSTEKVIDREGNRPKWEQIAQQNGILEYVKGDDGKVNKASYEAGLRRLLEERDNIRYDEPTLGETQALGRQTTLLDRLPRFYLLPAITDYSDEIDKRASSTVFRRLMGDLGDRLLRDDPRYSEIEQAIARVRGLLNEPDAGSAAPDAAPNPRLAILGTVEDVLKTSMRKLMPSVQDVKLKVVIEETQEVFSRGVELRVDDGVLTDVLAKGHGLQRCVVFALLQTLIQNVKGALSKQGDQAASSAVRPIILGIEEPELYIHPQLQRRVYQVLKDFAEEPDCDDQVMFTTHAPAFIDVAQYQRIGVVRKETTATGTRVHQCDGGVLGSAGEKKEFQLLTTFSLDHNRMFFAKRTILVEGPEDEVAIIAAARELGFITEFPEEIDYTIIVPGGKDELPKFQKLLNAFGLPYIVMLELDGNPETEAKNAKILELLNTNKCVRVPKRMEDMVGHTGHFNKKYDAVKWFTDKSHITPDWQVKVKEMFAAHAIAGTDCRQGVTPAAVAAETPVA